MASPLFYILLRDSQLDTTNTFANGSLWRHVEGSKVIQRVGDNEASEIVWHAHIKGNFRELSQEEFDLLFAVKKEDQRLGIIQDQAWIQEGLELREKDEVDIINHRTIPECHGVLHFKGQIDASSSAGVMFGVVLAPQFKGLGTSNGTFRKKEFFKCEKNGAVFVSLNYVRRHIPVPTDQDLVTSGVVHQGRNEFAVVEHDDNQDLSGVREAQCEGLTLQDLVLTDSDHSSGLPCSYSFLSDSSAPGPTSDVVERQGTTRNSNMSYATSSLMSVHSRGSSSTGHSEDHSCPEVPSIKLDDRVVWVSDTSIEHGTVKWLGKIPALDPKNSNYAGVAFDNPIGKGTGRYKGIQLFETVKGHASLVPVIGLLREEDLVDEPVDESLELELLSDMTGVSVIPDSQGQNVFLRTEPMANVHMDVKHNEQ